MMMQKFPNNMETDYRSIERYRQYELLRDKSFVFDGARSHGTRLVKDDKTNDLKEEKRYFYIYNIDRTKNLYAGIRETCIKYFNDEKIEFWKNGICEENIVPNHLLSSQISCLNHLFEIRTNSIIVQAVAQAIVGDTIHIIGVKPLNCDIVPEFIAFEVTSDNDYLDELGQAKSLKRGEMCTSIDALIIAETTSGDILIPIEWKYTESYNRCDKSIEDNPNKPSKKEAKGKERLHRYTHLIDQSDYLVSLGEEEYRGSIYYQEPFYQLMRQTLWSEQMLKHKDVERIKAIDYVHVHVVPQKNGSLLQQGYEWGDTMESAWMSHLTDKGKERYKIVSPEIIVDAIEKADKDKNYVKLIKYLRTRYHYDK